MALRIGKLARLTGRSVHTIRWYEAQRLIPGVRRDPQGRRVYHEQHVEWLALLERNGAKPFFQDRQQTVSYFAKEREELAPLVKELGLGAK